MFVKRKEIAMEILTYITENALILIPVLIIIGLIIKRLEFIPDKYIPVILLPFGIIGTVLLGDTSTLTAVVNSVIQGILVTGTAVYGNQIVKQLKKNE